MADTATFPVAPQAAGLKAKANEVGMKAYLAAPPKAQTALLNGYLKAAPVVAKVRPHTKKVLGAALGLVVVRKLRR